MDTIDMFIYINLSHRTDRRDEIEAELDKLGVPVEKRLRFEAIHQKPGWIGCTRSHSEVMKMVRDSNWSRVCIFEDDWMSVVPPETIREQLEVICGPSAPEWDVLLLSTYCQASEAVPEFPQIRRGFNLQTASSYIVNRHFFEPLCKNLEEAAQGALSGGNHWDYINDQYWKRIQPHSKWYYFSPSLGKQRPSFSDLSEKFVDYGGV